MTRRTLLMTLVSSGAGLAQKYSGPRPPKPDIPYLVHADNLVETEVSEAREEERRRDTVYIIAGETSSAATPLPEPIFLIQTENLDADRIELYRLEVRRGNREAVFPQRARRGGPRLLRLMTTRLDQNLYRIEVNEYLDEGEYSLTPAGSNQVFCFRVY